MFLYIYGKQTRGSRPPPLRALVLTAAAMNARMRLKEHCDTQCSWNVSYVEHKSGPGHKPVFRITVNVYSEDGDLKATANGEGQTKDHAKEMACTKALRFFEVEHTPAVRAAAWVGDAAAELLLALLASKAGFSAAQMDALSQSLCSNIWLAKSRKVQLSSTTRTATAAEAAVGYELAKDEDRLLDLLLPAVQRGNPALVEAMQTAVAGAAAAPVAES